MLRILVAWAGVSFPLLGVACDFDRTTCERLVQTLISYRAEAIVAAFGDDAGILPTSIQVKFVQSSDPIYAGNSAGLAYDHAQQTLFVPRRMTNTTLPNPLRWAQAYWPYYENEQYRNQFPIIAAIDSTLWSVYLLAAAQSHGIAWPHPQCASVNVRERLPCEMLLEGVSEHVRTLRTPLFNSNRLDRIWPEDFERFSSRVWRTDPEYLEVQRYGGILLVRPLVNEFGVMRALAYIAGTPFTVADDNLRASAQSYQERAREVLRAESSPLKHEPLTTASAE